MPTLRFVFVIVLSFIFNHLAACEITIESEPGPQGPAGEKGDPGENGIDGADGATGPQGPQGESWNDEEEEDCPVAYEHPGFEGQSSYLTGSNPIFIRGHMELSAGGVLHNTHYLGTEGGCGKGYVILDIRFYLVDFTSMPTDMEVDTFLGGDSYGTTFCDPIYNETTGTFIVCDLLGVDREVGAEPVQFSTWVMNLPELTQGAGFEFDVHWKDIATGTDHHFLVNLNRW